jgi:hypothetical protein
MRRIKDNRNKFIKYKMDDILNFKPIPEGTSNSKIWPRTELGMRKVPFGLFCKSIFDCQPLE